MKITSLTLKDFRNYSNQSFDFTSDKVVFCGDNGQGKTNILEAISLLSVGKSWREHNAETLIRHGESSAILEAKTSSSDQFKIKFQPRSRQFYRNDKPLPRTRFFGQVPTLLFCPEFIHLFSGTKTDRVGFFDRFLVQVYPRYREALLRANKAHKQKTKLLKNLSEEHLWDEKVVKSLLAPWNQVLVENLPVLDEIRRSFLEALNPFFAAELQKISGIDESITIQIKPAEFVSLEEESILSFFDRTWQREVAAKKNFLAAHRDDFEFMYRDKLLTETASRGESRSILLALVSAQKHFLKDAKGINPIVLLDDVFSELDADRQTHLEALAEGCQTFYTTTHKDHFDDFKSEVQVIEL